MNSYCQPTCSLSPAGGLGAVQGIDQGARQAAGGCLRTVERASKQAFKPASFSDNTKARCRARSASRVRRVQDERRGAILTDHNQLRTAVADSCGQHNLSSPLSHPTPFPAPTRRPDQAGAPPAAPAPPPQCCPAAAPTQPPPPHWHPAGGRGMQWNGGLHFT